MDIEAKLDKGDNMDSGDAKGGVQMEFMKAVQARLKVELKPDSEKKEKSADWLLAHLRENDFWIRVCHVEKVSRKLGIQLYWKRSRLP